METKHTKGEWKIAYSTDGYPEGVKTENNWICDTTFNNLKDCEANAKIIAAAPDLLEALDEALSLIKRNGYGDDHLIVEKIILAIKKATK